MLLDKLLQINKIKAMKVQFRLLIWLAAIFIFAVACEEADELLPDGNDNEQTEGDSTQDGDGEDGDSQEGDNQGDDGNVDDDNDDDVTVIPDGYIPIYSAEDMYNVRDSLDGNYILMKDIDLSDYSNWTPIGSYTSSSNRSPFKGVFDGANHTITGLVLDNASEGISYQGLFGYTSSATIENLTIKSPSIAGAYCLGAIAGRADSSSIINNCAIEGGSISGTTSVGGIVGYLSGSYATQCNNSASVSGSGENIGGVVGSAANSDILSCYNAGVVNGGNNIGGVAGDYYRSVYLLGSAETQFDNCYNIGEVSGTDYVGGVVGYLEKGISNSYNSAKVTGSGDNVGGIVGCISSSYMSNTYYTSTLYACYNTGSIKGEGQYCGGVAGKSSGSIISSSYNNGEVTGVEFVGGVVGNSQSSRKWAMVIACYNAATVRGTTTVGGIAGRSSAINSTMINIYATEAYLMSSHSTGEVYGDSNSGYVAGINNSESSAGGWIYYCGYIDQVGDNTDSAVGANSGSGTSYSLSLTELNSETYLDNAVNAYAADISVNNDIEVLTFTAGSDGYLPSLMGENIKYTGN